MMVAGVAAMRFVAAVYLLALGALTAAALLPLAAGWRANLIMSGSMAPRMPVGTLLMTSPVSAERLRPGTIVVMVDPTTPEGVIAHRFVARDASGDLVLKGDANPDVDPVARRPQQLLGEGRYIVPAVGVPVVWLHRGDVIPLACWICLTSAALMVVRRPWRTRGAGPRRFGVRRSDPVRS